MKRLGLATALALTLAIALPHPALAGTAWRETRFLYWLNQDRDPNLRRVDPLDALARERSLLMAAAGAISHSTLSCYCAEIVGSVTKGHLWMLYREFLASRLHRSLMLDPKYRRAGVSIVERNGVFYLTAIFSP